jgi:beta-phosphoglucomutase-like phosphatase (HAD superfamily)
MRSGLQPMPLDDRALLRDLTDALQRTEAADPATRQEAVRAVMEQHGATVDDVARLLRRARTQQRRQLQGLSARIDGIIANREEQESTVTAVEEFLRRLRP